MSRCAMCSATSELDHGLLCKACRAEDRLVTDECRCIACRSDMKGIAPCQGDDSALAGRE